jgi:hypothetical protein
VMFSFLIPECYNLLLTLPPYPEARRDAMRITSHSFQDDADAARHLLRHLRRMLLVCYDQETVSGHTLTEQHVADAFAFNARFRHHLALQGINPDTLVASTDEGRRMVGAIIQGWVRALRIPLDEMERSSPPAPRPMGVE